MDDLNIECSGCGASLSYSPGQKSLKCPQCKAKLDIPQPELEMVEVDNCDGIVPLIVSEKEVTKSTHIYMASGDYTPDDLVEKARVQKQVMYYLPAYLFYGTFKANWTASFGYDRQEQYTVYVNKSETINGKTYTHKEPETRTKTVTDWRPNSGVAKGSYAKVAYAGAFESPSVREVLESTGVDNRTKFNKKFTVGIQTEGFSIQADDAFSRYAKPVLDSAVERAVKSHAQGDHQKDWHWDYNYFPEQENLLLPLCYSEFEYEGNIFSLWISGANKNSYRGDKLPVDIKKKIAVYIGLIPLTVALLTFVIFNSTYNIPFGNYAFIATTLTSLYALLRRTSMIGYSKAKRNKIVGQRHAELSGSEELTESEKNMIARSYDKVEMPYIADKENDLKVLGGLSFIAILLICIPLIEGQGFSNNSEPATPEALTAAPAVEQETSPSNDQSIGDTPPQAPAPLDNSTQANIESKPASYGYMSFYLNPNTRNVGYSWNQNDPDLASQAAKNACEKQDPAVQCQKIGDPIKGYRCLAIARASDGTVSWGVGLNDGVSAETESIKHCAKSDCKVVQTKCAD